MSTLLLRLAAPLQAWGVASKFDHRDTQREPTKSGVIGMVAAALGLRREDPRTQALGQALRFGLRVDREGSLLHDYHTARNQRHAYVTHRYYLCDAIFLVGLSGEEDLLQEIEAALHAPAYPLFLGRRACPPEGRLCLGIRPGLSLMEALKAEPPLCPVREGALRIQVEAQEGDVSAYLLRDQPISFDQRLRLHGFRRVAETYHRLVAQEGWPSAPHGGQTEHDAFLGWEG